MCGVWMFYFLPPMDADTRKRTQMFEETLGSGEEGGHNRPVN